MGNDIVVICPVCTREVPAKLTGTGLLLACHQVPETRFPCPHGGTMVASSAVTSWRGGGERPGNGQAGSPARRDQVVSDR
jgi:hypothetical protein